jgi:hypothetical protein
MSDPLSDFERLRRETIVSLKTLDDAMVGNACRRCWAGYVLYRSLGKYTLLGCRLAREDRLFSLRLWRILGSLWVHPACWLASLFSRHAKRAQDGGSTE